MNDGSAIDTNVFTIDVTSATKSIAIFSDSIGEAQLYTFKIAVEYTNYPVVNDETLFTVNIVDSCSVGSGVSTTPSAVIPD